MSFFAIHIPSVQDGDANNDKIHVFTDKKKAFDMLKNHKEARLKVFATNEDAIHFSQNGLEIISTSNSLSTISPTTPVVNKAPFRGPKSQELVAFRKCIEQGKYDEVEEIIWNNPRYLVGSGDTPTILKESFRYNALHVAALSRNAKITELILQTIGNPSFVQLLQGKKDAKTCEDVSAILLDLYLNMPEKGRSETPLHLAVKHGATDVVEVLTSYPQCSITPNSFGQFPKDIICMRVDHPSTSVVNQITCLLEERFYVPVIRSVDNSTPPIVGEPFSPMNPPNLIFDPLSPEMEIQAYAGPMNKEQAITFRRRWKTPPRIQNSPNESQDSSPNRNSYVWSPSPKQLNRSSTPISVEKDRRGARQLFASKLLTENLENNNHMDDGKKTENIEWPENATDTENVLIENIDNQNGDGPPQLNHQKFDLFSNYRDRRLLTLEDSLISVSSKGNVSQNVFESPLYKERHLRLIDAEKGLELFGRQLAKDQNIAWKEYWHFLGCFIDISSVDGLDKLENYLQKNHESTNAVNWSERKPMDNVMNLCNALDKLELREGKLFNRHENILRNGSMAFKPIKTDDLPMPFSINSTSSSSCAYLCVEKSCQVYARRMTKTIIQHSNSVISINDTLKSELKRLKSLIHSYREDQRFVDVNFQWTHSRFANLIISYLKSENNCDLELIKDVFQQILQSTQRLIETNPVKNECTTMNGDVFCLLNFLLDHMKNKDYIISPEVLTTEKECTEIWSAEKRCYCSWTTIENNRLNRHIKRNKKSNFNFLSTNSELGNFVDWRNDSDDEFLSDSGSEKDVYFTPPESPSAFIESDDSFEDCDTAFKNYILGDEPTKTDVDVLNALCNIEIDSESHPNIHAWKMAILEHTAEERNNFPSPSVVVKSSTVRNRTQASSELPIKRLMYSPVKKMLPFANCLKPSAFDQRSCDSSDGSSSATSMSFSRKLLLSPGSSPLSIN